MAVLVHSLTLNVTTTPFTLSYNGNDDDDGSKDHNRNLKRDYHNTDCGDDHIDGVD